MNALCQEKKSLDYLLLPSPPTPNGRLHLGHIGGPYLRMDILKRGVEMLGHSANIVLTLDDYESFVMLSAKNKQWTVNQVIDHYKALIEKDLSALNIDAVIIDPLDQDYDSIYRQFSNDSVSNLVSQGLTEYQSEGYFYPKGSDNCISGAWLIGTCPSCRMQVSGDCCDGCSLIIKPQELLEPYSRFDVGQLTQVDKSVLYYKVPDVAGAIENIKIDDFHRETIKKQWQRADNKIRLSVPQLQWGLALTSVSALDADHVFSYSSLGLYLTSGEYVARQREDKRNPFADQNAKIVMGFGIDNLIHMTYINTLLIANGYRGFDWTLPNYFMQLTGSKFSTSSNHAIWAAEFVDKSFVNIDLLRFHMATISPEYKATNFALSQFNNHAKTTDEKFKQLFTDAFSQFEPNSYVCELISDAELEEVQAQIETLYSEQQFSLLRLVEQIKLLTEQPPNQPSACAKWLLQLTMLLYPIMPDLGKSLWRCLGFKGDKPAFAGIRPDAEAIKPYSHQLSASMNLSDYQHYL